MGNVFKRTSNNMNLILSKKSQDSIIQYLNDSIEHANIDTEQYYLGQVKFAFALHVIDSAMMLKMCKKLQERKKFFN